MKLLAASLRSGSPVEFSSDYTLAESVERLRAATLPPGFDAESTESMMGNVEQDKVVLEHNLPWPDNQTFRARFIGSFQHRDSKVILLGQFIEDPWLRRFLNPCVRLSRREFLQEVQWLSAAIDQALTRAA